ncbi:VOC family protein [Agromyces badenianii]|uniref:VOC family protein n=1 Tax=Agromyces badenianii TaxID=2080742 RepID=UPI000D5A1E96|nr:VOC family protein [Agromyces badenianii]PWC03603.1 glyoxalase [Agromyces badenianii]
MTATSIFVNLPTTDLERSKSFYEALGFSINPLFTDENAACVVLSDTIYFMVLTREYLGTFTDKQIIDPKTQAQVSIALSRDSRESVDDVLAKGLAAGGSEPREAQDYGFMYSRDLDDPDGNNLSFLFMEPAAAEKGPEVYMAEQGAAASA